MEYRIPKEVLKVSEGLRNAGFESYLVGGCVRDLLVGKEPKDWDITTNATPDQIQAVFPDSFIKWLWNNWSKDWKYRREGCHYRSNSLSY